MAQTEQFGEQRKVGHLWLYALERPRLNFLLYKVYNLENCNTRVLSCLEQAGACRCSVVCNLDAVCNACPWRFFEKPGLLEVAPYPSVGGMPGPGIITIMHYIRRELWTFITSKGIQLPNILKNGMNPKGTVLFVMSPAVSGDFICVAPSESMILVSMWRLWVRYWFVFFFLSEITCFSTVNMCSI